MIVTRHTTIATWVYEDYAHPAPMASPSDLYHSLNMCQQVATILQEEQLLLEPTVRLGKWFNKSTNKVVDEPYTEVKLDDSTEIVSSCKKALDDLESQRGYLHPNNLMIEGKGLIYINPNQTLQLPDIAWVDSTYLGFYFVSINTQTDAWLPYTLRGQPQYEIYTLNAPRLETALRKIETVLSIKPDDDKEAGEYAIKQGYRLDNIRDVDNEPLDIHWVRERQIATAPNKN